MTPTSYGISVRLEQGIGGSLQSSCSLTDSAVLSDRLLLQMFYRVSCLLLSLNGSSDAGALQYAF